MSKLTGGMGVLLLLNSVAWVGCGVAPHASYQTIEARPMSASRRASIQQSASESAAALSRMDAYRAGLERADK